MRLLAATSTQPFDRVMLISSDAFAIAKLRFVSVPEPATIMLLLLSVALRAGSDLK